MCTGQHMYWRYSPRPEISNVAHSMLHSSFTCLTEFDLWVLIAFVAARTARLPFSFQPASYSPLPTWPTRYRVPPSQDGYCFCVCNILSRFTYVPIPLLNRRTYLPHTAQECCITSGLYPGVSLPCCCRRTVN